MMGVTAKPAGAPATQRGSVTASSRERASAGMPPCSSSLLAISRKGPPPLNSLELRSVALVDHALVALGHTGLLDAGGEPRHNWQCSRLPCGSNCQPSRRPSSIRGKLHSRLMQRSRRGLCLLPPSQNSTPSKVSSYCWHRGKGANSRRAGSPAGPRCLNTKNRRRRSRGSRCSVAKQRTQVFAARGLAPVWGAADLPPHNQTQSGEVLVQTAPQPMDIAMPPMWNSTTKHHGSAAPRGPRPPHQRPGDTTRHRPLSQEGCGTAGTHLYQAGPAQQPMDGPGWPVLNKAILALNHSTMVTM
jgi:hypothetical protein